MDSIGTLTVAAALTVACCLQCPQSPVRRLLPRHTVCSRRCFPRAALYHSRILLPLALSASAVSQREGVKTGGEKTGGETDERKPFVFHAKLWHSTQREVRRMARVVCCALPTLRMPVWRRS